MSGFCGWIGGGDGALDAAATLEGMARGLPCLGDFQSQSSAAPTAALAQRAHPREGSWWADSDLWVTIEGYPVWSDPGRARTAQDRGHAYTLARAYRDDGEALFGGLRGPFSLAVVDKTSSRGLLAIDRFGVHPLCYARCGDGTLVFGSTADSVRAHPGVGATIVPQSIFNFLYFVDRIPAPDTIYEEQKKLLPGQFIRFDGGRVEAKTYWRMPYREDGDGSTRGELADELRTRLREAVAAGAAGEDPADVGAFLSGGLDSSTIVAFLSELSTEKARTFTIGFDDARYDESRYASLVADAFHTRHQTHNLRAQDIVDIVPRISRAYDEPFANSSVIPAYTCALRAKEAGVEVMLAGDGGDELFAGNSRYVEDQVFAYYNRVPGFFRRGLIEPVVNRMPGRDRIPLFRKAAKYISLARLSAAARLNRNNVFADIDAADLFSAEALAAIDPTAPVRFAEEVFAKAGARSELHKMLYFDLRVTLADSDLRKVGRMCELAGVRVRYPFLDEDLAEFSARIPPPTLLAGGELRSFYKGALAGILPAETIGKHKHGFGLPYLEFVNDYKPLQDISCDSLESLKGRGYFRNACLDELIARTRKGESTSFGGVVWDLMVLEQWLQSRPLPTS